MHGNELLAFSLFRHQRTTKWSVLVVGQGLEAAGWAMKSSSHQVIWSA